MTAKHVNIYDTLALVRVRIPLHIGGGNGKERPTLNNPYVHKSRGSLRKILITAAAEIYLWRYLHIYLL